MPPSSIIVIIVIITTLNFTVTIFTNCYHYKILPQTRCHQSCRLVRPKSISLPTTADHQSIPHHRRLRRRFPPVGLQSDWLASSKVAIIIFDYHPAWRPSFFSLSLPLLYYLPSFKHHYHQWHWGFSNYYINNWHHHHYYYYHRCAMIAVCGSSWLELPWSTLWLQYAHAVTRWVLISMCGGQLKQFRTLINCILLL